MLLPSLTIALSPGFRGVLAKSWLAGFIGGGKEGCDGEGEGGGEGSPGRRGLWGRGRSLNDLRLSAGELGRSLSSDSPGSFLTTGPGLRHLDKNF